MNSSSSGATRRSSTADAFSEEAIAIATEIAENEVCDVTINFTNELLSWPTVTASLLSNAGCARPFSKISFDSCWSYSSQLSSTVFESYHLHSCSSRYAAATVTVSTATQTADNGLHAAAVTAYGGTINSASNFNPYSSEEAFYLAAYIFEDVGVTAYKGAVQVLQVTRCCCLSD